MLNFILGCFAGALVVVVVMCALTMGKVADLMAQRDNPRYFSQKMEKK